MAQAAAATGAGPTVMVAIEQHFPSRQRIISDELAGCILPFGARMLVHAMRPSFARNWMIGAAERAFPGLWSGIICRKRAIDDALAASAGEIEAMVNLGAGFDTRACRLPFLAHIPVWEIDQPANLNPKRDRLRRCFGDVPRHVVLVPIDFDREALGPALAARAYAPQRRTFFIWEAVTQYLSEGGVRATLDFLAAAAPGSRLAFTYVLKDFVDGRNLHGQERLHARYVARNIWRFGLEPGEVSAFLARYGWRVQEHLGCDELAGRYVTPTGRRLATWPIERIVHAEKL